MAKKALFILLALVLSTGLSAGVAEGLSIVTTDFPCYDLVRAVTGGEAEVTMLLKPGMEAHTYDPSPSDILAIGSADLFVCIGGESDSWAEDVISSMGAEAPRTLRLIETVDALSELKADEPGEAPALDEHIWTSPRNARRMLDAVEQALVAAAPDEAELFQANAKAYGDEIDALDEQLQALVAGAKRRTLVFADRFPFQYLTHDYGLDYKAAFLSCTAQTEPSARVVVELIGTVIEEQIPVVYTIELSNGAIAQTILQETGVPSAQLDSMQTVSLDDFEAGETYVSIMQRNLEAIERGLY
ncbi:MAG: zinc ABC transporter substrate-binding protein [Clostridiales bacterium]|nr:zinc ABC transporter substrate-binding protein [Clostridiales bacterium]